MHLGELIPTVRFGREDSSSQLVRSYPPTGHRSAARQEDHTWLDGWHVLRIGLLQCRSETKVGSRRAWQHITPRLVSADADISLACGVTVDPRRTTA